MQLTGIILLAACLQVSATAFGQKVTISEKNVSMQKVFKEIRKQTDYNFIYSNKTIRQAKSVTLNEKNVSVQEVLDKVFTGQPLTYTIDGKIIIVRRKSVSPVVRKALPTKEITGIVTDSATGQLLAGVTIKVKGENIGTVTDAEGRFSLEVQDGAMLVVSYLGYAPKEIAVNGRTDFNISLAATATGLNQLVVVGYGTQKKKTVTGSIASIQGGEITSVKVPSVTNSLAGKLPGLRVIQRSGEPGDDVADIDIRGFGDPLVIVDGVERDFSEINPNDIAAISILKDASAAIYGFKGANGVILVTTKKGETGKPQVSYSGFYGFQRVTRFPKLYNSFQYASLYNEAQQNIGVTPPYSQEELEKYKSGKYPDFPNNNWWDLMTRSFTPEMKHSLNVSGGTERIKYYFSFGYLKQEAMWESKNGGYNRYNIRSNVSADITKGLRIGLELSGRLGIRKKPSDVEQFKAYFKVHPNIPIYANNNPKYYQAVGDNANPIQSIYFNEVGYNRRDRRGFNSTLTVSWDVPWVNGLSAKALLAYDYNNLTTKHWDKAYGGYQYDVPSDSYIKKSRRGLNELRLRSENDFSPTQQYSLNYDNAFGRNNIRGMLLWEMKNNRDRWFSAYRQFSISAIDQMDAGDNINKRNGGNEAQGSHEGLVGRINYSYDNKYLAEFSFRYDGSYKFAKDKRWGFFPSFSAGWVISNEEFFNNNFSFIDNLKIRGSYGKVGDASALSPFQYLIGYTYPSNSFILGSGGVLNGAATTGIPNPNLTWYVSNIVDVGFDLDAWNGLLSVTFDYFERNRDGLLATRTLALPITFGASLPEENLNSDRTRGFEISIGHRNRIGEFYYSLKANFTTTRNFNIHVEQAVPQNKYDNWRFNKDNRYKNITWGYEAIGQFQNFKEILNAPIQDNNGNHSLLPGDIRYADVNGDGIIDKSDQVPIGHGSAPSMFYGLNLSGSWKNFDFIAFFQGAAGHEINIGETFTDPFIQQGLGNGVVFWLNRWHREDPKEKGSKWVPGYMPAVRPSGFELNNQISTWTLLDEDYLRLKTIELGYSLPKNLLSSVGISNTRIYVNCYNLITLTKGKRMKYMDPENSEVNLHYYPQMKSYNFGINLTF